MAAQGIVEFPEGSGTLYFAYHDQLLAEMYDGNRQYERNIAFDRIYINATDRTLLPVATTPSWLRPARFLDPYQTVPAVTMAEGSLGMQSIPALDTAAGALPLALGYVTLGAWTRVRFVDFGAVCAAQLLVRAASPLGATIEVYLDSMQGSPLATCAVPATQSFGSWVNVSCALSGCATGVHDLYFNFTDAGAAYYLLNLEWWQFLGGQTSGQAPPATRVAVALETAAGFVAAAAVGAAVTASAAAPQPVTLADNEDGTWALLLPALQRFACVAADGTLTASATTATAPCARSEGKGKRKRKREGKTGKKCAMFG